MANFLLFGDFSWVEWSILALLAGWLFFAWNAFRNGISVLPLPRPDPRCAYPSLAVFITARNEAATIAESLLRWKKVRYPGKLQICVVNDRSDDATADIIKQYTSGDERFVFINIDELPSGWLGKVHALQKAYCATDSDWILCTDADIRFSEDALERAFAAIGSHNLDHLALIPESDSPSLGVKIMTTAFGSLFIQAIQAKKLNEGGDAFAGVGAFNAVRRSLLSNLGGFAPLRMEVIDDVGLGCIVSQQGGRSRLMSGKGHVFLNWYPSLWEMIKGLEKNLFAAFGQYNYATMALYVLLLLFFVIAPYVLLALSHSPVFILSTLFMLHILPAVAAFFFGRTLTISPAVAALLPVGYLCMLVAMVRSAYLFYRRGGVAWRNSLYPASEIRKGVVVRFSVFGKRS